MKRDIDLAPDDFMENILRSAANRWPGYVVQRIARPWLKGTVFSYGICRDGSVIAYARVNRAGAVQWVTPLPYETWTIMPEERDKENTRELQQ